MGTLKTPDVTPMQMIVGAISGLVTAVIGMVAAFGWAELSLEQTGALLGAWAAFGSVLVLADAIIRNGRSRALLNPQLLEPVLGPPLYGAVEETAPGYAGERIVHREDTTRGEPSEGDLEV